MKRFRHFLLTTLAVILTLCATVQPARAAVDGSLDTTFDAGITGNFVTVTSIQADGKTIIAGGFTSVLGTPRNNIARINVDGTLDTDFDPNANASIFCVAVQPDGKILLGGNFTTLQPNGAASPTARQRIARLNADGSLDTSFDPKAVDTVYSVVVQTDGRILLGGAFNTLQPNGAVSFTSRQRIARVNANGTLDTGFDPKANGNVYGMALQPDGRILIGGDFTTLQPNGSAGATAQQRIARLNADGTLDVTFNPQADNTVKTLALQADGRILLGGDFAALQPNGAIAPTTRVKFARLMNGPALQTLTAPSSTQVLWTRTGTTPEVTQVTFEKSSDGGVTWTPLGAGTRVGVTTDWQITDISLPDFGLLRASGRAASGYQNGSSGMVEQEASFVLVPEISISGNSVEITDGDSTPSTGDHSDFGSINVTGGSVVHTFTIINTGTLALNLTSEPKVLISGLHSADFSVNTQPASPVAALTGTTTFQITFDPSAGGTRSASVRIDNDDGDEDPYNFSISGTGFVSADADLTSLITSAGTLTPGFDAGTTSYAASVGYTSSSLSVTPTHSDANAAIQVRINSGGYASVDSGTASASLPLNTGSNTIDVLVTAQDGSTVKTYTLTVTRRDTVRPGDVDEFDANVVGGMVLATAVQPDGKTIIAGLFHSLLGSSRGNMARLNADGSLDMDFNPNIDDTVRSVAVQADGKILLAGQFSNVEGVPRSRIARLNADGTLDTGFDPNANSQVESVAVQADGRILLGGTFSSVGGTTRNGIARISASGSLDAGFNPNANGAVNGMVVQADGNILLIGGFTSIGGTTRNRIARVNADGLLDTGFDPGADNLVNCAAMTADGKMILGGDFLTISGSARHFLARINSDGSLDTDFNPNPDSSVFSLAVQANGQILLGGQFSNLGGTARLRIARVNADGTLDQGFAPVANGTVLCVAIQADGQVLAGGQFSTMDGVTRNRLARLLNDTATQTLSAVDPTQIVWARGGGAPEVSQVSFDQSSDGGMNWTPLGNGSRAGTTSNWQLTGLSLSPSIQVRALARTVGAFQNGSSGLLQHVASLALFEIAIIGNGVEITDGDASPSLIDHTDFGSTNITGASVVRTFTITNTGSLPLNLTGTPKVVISGAHAADFSVAIQPTSPVGALTGSTTFQIAFDPSAPGTRSAAVSISNTDGDENPCNFSIQGSGVEPEITVEQPRGSNLGSGTLRSFGAVPVGCSADMVFTVKNTGGSGSSLTGLGITLSGTDASQFSVVSSPTAPVEGPDGSTNYVVRYAPTIAGAKTATLQLVSNDGDENPFRIQLSGTTTTGVTAAFAAAATVGATLSSVNATGRSLTLTLNFAPSPGTNLTVIKNTGTAFIQGAFSNIANGATVPLSFRGQTYPFVAWYYGGDGNDLVLLWPYTNLAAWGYNEYGQLGDGTGTSQPSPVAVDQSGVLTGKLIVQVARGDNHSLALCTDGTLVAWGQNVNGQLGDNTWNNSYAPVAVNRASGISALFGKTVIAIAAGNSHSLALCSDGTLAAWGQNGNGQLGDNTTTHQPAPVAVNTDNRVSALFGKIVTSIAAGGYHSLAFCSDGTLAAWGYNAYGQLGLPGINSGNQSVPAAVSTASGSSALFGKTVTAISAGIYHSLVLCSDGSLAGWGYNGNGQLGNNTTTDQSAPVAVSTASGTSSLHGKTVTALTAAGFHNLALCSDGTVAAWGGNSFGQLGDNSADDRQTPVSVNAINGTSALFGKTVIALAAGSQQGFALCSDGTLAAWGYNAYGQLGDNSTTNRPAPVAVNTVGLLAGRRISSLGASPASYHSLAIYGTTPGTFVFDQSGYAVAEGGNATLTINRILGTRGSVSVKVATSILSPAPASAATAVKDYTANTQTLVFADGETSKTFDVQTLAETPPVVEPNETFLVTLSAPSGGAILGSPGTARVTLIDPSATLPADITPPGLTISTPAEKALVGVTTTADTSVTGIATDTRGVQKVEVRNITSVGSTGPLTLATLGTPGGTSTTFSASITPVTGLNTVEVIVTDYKGNTKSLTRFFTVTRSLQVLLSGSGSLTPGFVGTTFREVGKVYTITATPSALPTATGGQVFNGWAINDLTGTDVIPAKQEFQVLTFRFT